MARGTAERGRRWMAITRVYFDFPARARARRGREEELEETWERMKRERQAWRDATPDTGDIAGTTLSLSFALRHVPGTHVYS